MKIADVMTTIVVTVTPTTSLSQISDLFTKKHYNAIPVIDQKRHLAGIITKEDLLQSLYPNYIDLVADFSQASDFEEMEKKVGTEKERKVQEIMRSKVIFARMDTPAMRALSRMIAHRINQLPVLNDDDEVVGMVTKGDIFYALFGKHARPVRFKKAIT